MTQIRVKDLIYAEGNVPGPAAATANASLTAHISNIRLEVETDTTPPVISSVAAGGITRTSATITWNTNENSDSQVEYGTTTAYGQSTALNPALVTAHSQGLSGLTPGTVYHYRVKSRDASGNLAVSGDFSFTTIPLIISNVAAGGITASSATITWITNDNSDSQVEYGVDTGYGLSAPTTPNPALVTAHSQVLSGLTSGTVYHYRVKSRNAAGTLAVSGDFTFTTTQNGSIPLDGLASLSYNSANNRINTPGFEYDTAGNQTRAVIDASGTQQQYRYDCAGRLAQVLDGSGNVLATYSYGAGNQRLMSVEGGVTKYFAWVGGKIIAEYEAWGANALIWKKSYVYLGGSLLATTSGADGTETRFHHSDRLGTRLVTDAGGTVVTEQLSMPFGTMLPFTQTYGGENSYQHPALSNPSKKRFTTYDRSDATGLDYAVNRHYSSAQGRFTQVDPLEMDAASLNDPQTLNMYAYCGNDPINNVDPDGLFWGAIGRFFKAIGKAILSIFTSGGGASSGPDFRTPPTFPGSLPGINAAERSGMGGFRTPPFNPGASGFLGQDKKALGNLIKGVKPSELEELIQAIIAQRDLVGAGLNSEFLARLSNKQIIAIRDALRNRNITIISDHEIIVHIDDPDIPNIRIVGVEQPGTSAPKPTPIPPSEARAAAERLGYNKVVKDPPFNSHGQKVFTNGKDFITRDVDAHLGGVWKKFNRRGQRIGTYDANLNPIGK
jgi:RHS repeat-associated protein